MSKEYEAELARAVARATKELGYEPDKDYLVAAASIDGDIMPFIELVRAGYTQAEAARYLNLHAGANAVADIAGAAETLAVVFKDRLAAETLAKVVEFLEYADDEVSAIERSTGRVMSPKRFSEAEARQNRIERAKAVTDALAATAGEAA